jgi:hypothetical protein
MAEKLIPPKPVYVPNSVYPLSMSGLNDYERSCNSNAVR